MKKILSDFQIQQIKGGQIVLVGGCFDILHAAHIEFLNKAKEQGKILVVLLESDENIRKLKGDDRPVNNQMKRAKNLLRVEAIDFIVLLKMPDTSKYYYNLVNLLSPAIIAVTSNDPLITVKRDQANQVGGKVVEVMDRNTKFSSTWLIKNNSI